MSYHLSREFLESWFRLVFKNKKFLPYKMIVQGSSTLWYRAEVGDEDNDFHVAQIWHGDGQFHVAGEYGAIFQDLESAQKFLDEKIVEGGGIIVPENLVPFL